MHSDGDILTDALSEEQEALDLMRSGKLELARYRLAKLSKKFPQHAKFHFNYALVLYKLKNFEEALDEVNTGLWLKPDDAKATQFKQELLTRMAKSNPTKPMEPTRSERTIVAPLSSVASEETSEQPEDEIMLASEGQPETISEPILAEIEQVPTSLDDESTSMVIPGSLAVIEEKEEIPEVAVEEKEEIPEAAIEEKEEIPEAAIEEKEEIPEVAIEEKEEIPEAAIEEKEEIPEAAIEEKEEIPEAPIEEKEEIPEAAIEEKEEIPELEHRPESIPDDLVHERTVPEPSEVQDFPESFVKNLKSSLSSEIREESDSTESTAELQEPEEEKITPVKEISPDQELPSTDSTETSMLSHEDLKQPADELAAPDVRVLPSNEPVVIEEASKFEMPEDDVQIIDETGTQDYDSVPIEIIEVEPRVAILEKAADVTVEHGDLESSPETTITSEDDDFKIQEVQGPIIVEPSFEAETKNIEPDEVKPEVPAGRLINLKDLFKESKEKIMESCEAATPESEQQAILHDTVDLEPFDESRLITFKTLHELDAYKCSIQALVIKYLDKKTDRDNQAETEIPAAGVLDAEAAAIEEMEPLEYPESDNDIMEMRTLDAISATTASIAPESISKKIVNEELDQELLETLVDARDFAQHYPVDFDLKTGIEQKILEKVKPSVDNVPSPAGDVLAQIIEMQTYVENIRLNRNLLKNKQDFINNMLGNETATILAEIESTSRPSIDYSPSKTLEPDAFSGDQQLDRLDRDEQSSFTDAGLNEVLGMVQQLGENLSNETVKGDTSKMKEVLAKIKRVTHGLYENAQYEQAVTIYTQILNYFPEDFEALFNTGFCYREMGNYKDGEKIFKRIIELFYDNAYAWYNLSLIYALTNEGDKESYCLQKAREFGYVVDINRLSRLNLTYAQKNPFDFE
ncbi:MAG TPA: tetratricopeptide repeat protein [Candidatus Lokiarchaeia archaeon]|nr:tetratricopeptide repeat protein [Candidatus Lokiarchaeia archaeon]